MDREGGGEIKKERMESEEERELLIELGVKAR